MSLTVVATSPDGKDSHVHTGLTPEQVQKVREDYESPSYPGWKVKVRLPVRGGGSR